MRDYRSLKVLDKFSGLFQKSGVNYPVMRRILQVKLTMDARRVPTVIGKSSKKDASNDDNSTKTSNNFVKSLWLYILFGLVSIPFILMGKNYIFQMSLLFGVFMFMLLTSLISDFSSVLLDIRDRNILSTKPVDRKTIAMAKTMHILIYMFFLTGAITAIPLIVGLVKHGIWFFLVFLIEIILMDMLIVVITALVYLAVLKFFDGEKLKDMINYVQIGLTIGITLGYQLLVRLFGIVDMGVVFQPKWWQFFLPPVWFGASFETLLHGAREPLFIVFSLLALFVPIAAFLIYLKLMPSLERNLQKLSDPGGRSRKKNGFLLKGITNLVCKETQEKVFFRFAWMMMGKEREFKLKVYPNLGFSIIFPYIYLFSGISKNGLQGLAGTQMYLVIYFCAMLVPSVVMMMRYSSKYKAAWIYQAAPISDHAPIYRGALKACIVRLLLPLFLLNSCIFLFLFGQAIIPDMIVVVLSFILYPVICFAYMGKALPFSEPTGGGQQTESIRMIPFMLILVGFALLHWLALSFNYGIYGYMIVLVLANLFAWKWAFSPKMLQRGAQM
ncbi:hypothetical protein [Paenibacillus segetis]|uniref:ABC-2 type transport system permease protein n=1 Tax=Paenibacillus segetis TaxID=1325360 RepID=A0ABQ1YN26_9BACL|nr:hypothetical protein [Paenibacillus segetis]GGH32279.1 hypothetical protein GCM10008013_36600 [Paenibacillus segetis]